MYRIAMMALLLFSGHASADDLWKNLTGRWQGCGEVSGMSALIELLFGPLPVASTPRLRLPLP